jgi:hypothetical protein
MEDWYWFSEVRLDIPVRAGTIIAGFLTVRSPGICSYLILFVSPTVQKQNIKE